MKFGDGSVKGLGGRSALEFKVHLFWMSATTVVRGGGHKGGELFGMEGCVLDRGVAESARRERERERERERGRLTRDP